MDLRLNMLTQNTALPTDSSLPTPNSRRAKTNLRALAARVQANGLRIDPLPDIPAGAPSWNECVQMLPKRDKREYEDIIKTFSDSCRARTTINVHCEGLLSNKDRPDGKQLGTASAVLYRQGRELSHAKQTFGESVTETDASQRALKLGLDTLTDSLTAQPPYPHTTILLLTSSTTAVSKVLDASPHEEQKTSIECMERIDEILRAHPDTDIRIS